MKKFLIGVVFPIFLVIAGIGAIIYGYVETSNAKASNSWPVVQGKILSSEVGSYLSRSAMRYIPKISYEFEVDGEVFTGKKVMFADVESSSKGSPQRLVSKYPQGSSADVYYKPENPAVSVLLPGNKGLRTSAGYLFGGLLLAMSIGVFFQMRTS